MLVSKEAEECDNKWFNMGNIRDRRDRKDLKFFKGRLVYLIIELIISNIIYCKLPSCINFKNFVKFSRIMQIIPSNFYF